MSDQPRVDAEKIRQAKTILNDLTDKTGLGVSMKESWSVVMAVRVVDEVCADYERALFALSEKKTSPSKAQKTKGPA